MILIIVAELLLLADLIMTYYAIKKFGTEIENNPIIKVLMKWNYIVVVIPTALYMIAVYYFGIRGQIDFASWVFVIGFNLMIFVNNVRWFRKYWRG